MLFFYHRTADKSSLSQGKKWSQVSTVNAEMHLL